MSGACTGIGDERKILLYKLAQNVEFARTSKANRLLHRPFRFARVAVHRYWPWDLSDRVGIKTFAGDSFRVELTSTSQESYKYGFHEADLTTACIVLLERGGVFVDVGANFGYFTVLAARLVGPSGAVYAFEPTPRTFKTLRRNVEGHPNVITEQAAVASANGTATLMDYGSEYGGLNTLVGRPRGRFHRRATPYDVPTRSLDDYFRDAKAPTFVKIDAENSEMDILIGMSEICRRYKPAISVEVGDPDPEAPGQSRALVDLLISRGYLPHEMHGNELRAHTPMDNYRFANLIFIHSDRATSGAS